MRRMYSDGQVVKVVNKAIEEGEIQAGGLPEIESGDAGKALVVNAGETGAEWATVGLSPEDQEKLDNSLQTIVLNFNNSNVLNNLDEALYTKLTTAGSQYFVKIINASSTYALEYNTYYKQSYSNPLVYESFLSNGATVQDTSTAPFRTTMLFKGKITFQGIQGGRQAVLAKDTSLTKPVVSIQYDNTTWYKLLPEGLTGTDTALKNKDRIAMGRYLSIAYSDLTNKQIIKFYVNRVSWNNANSQDVIYASGKDADYDYSLEWNTFTGAYTITKTTRQ